MFKVLSVNQTLHLRAFQDRWTFLNQHDDSFDWLGFLDKSNLLKIPDCRSFSVLKTLTGYRPYSYSIKGKPCSRSCLLCSKFSLTELVLKRRSASPFPFCDKSPWYPRASLLCTILQNLQFPHLLSFELKTMSWIFPYTGAENPIYPPVFPGIFPWLARVSIPRASRWHVHNKCISKNIKSWWQPCPLLQPIRAVFKWKQSIATRWFDFLQYVEEDKGHMIWPSDPNV